MAGAYLMALMGILFMVGARFVVENGAGPREMLIAGVAFWIGAGFQNGDVFADRLGAWCGRAARQRHGGGRPSPPSS